MNNEKNQLKIMLVELDKMANDFYASHQTGKMQIAENAIKEIRKLILELNK